MDKFHIDIDGFQLSVDPDFTIMKAAESEDIFIPHLCHHPDLPDTGGCGLCVVEIEGETEPLRACMTKVKDGMKIITKSERLDQMRRLSMELMLANHIDDCTTCPKYLKCELQSLIQYLSVSTSRMRRTLNSTPVNTSNPLIVRDLNRCVSCGRCVRVCRDVRGVGILEYQKNEYERTFVGVTENKSLAEANCMFCGACIEVCPTGALQDKDGLFKEGIREEVLVPCKNECPAHIDVPRYIRFIKEGNYSQAAAVVREKAPFPRILGMICVRFCEKGCRRNELSGPLSIRELKRFAAENDDFNWKEKAFKKQPTGKKVAVIGSGPAGLTSAYFLSKLGHTVDVYEKLPIPGGMMAAGIPEYRLPLDVVNEEIEIIKEFGVNIITNSKIEGTAQLIEKGYDSVLIAVGTDKGVRIPIPGANLPDVHLNIDFLRQDLSGEPINLKQSAIVLGGGNVAFDCARSLKRYGVDKITLICLEDRETMPADREEIEEALEEGIEIINNRTFIKIQEKQEKVTGVKCRTVEDFNFDHEGKLNLNIVENSDEIISGEMVIFAVGQKPDLEGFKDLSVDKKGNLLTGKNNDTNIPGIFAAGDVITGTSSVIEAVANGRAAASSVDIFLGGDGNIYEELSEKQNIDNAIGVIKGFSDFKRTNCALLSPSERADNFDLINKGLTETQAIEESSRCLQCDLRPQLTKQKFWSEYSRR